MKRTLLKTTLFVCICILGINHGYSQQLAFPGAEGFGKYATGGRKGTIYRVTNLNDSGSGSLRDAVSQSNRIVVFDVAGVIRINSRIVVKNNIYIAGQTAPGEGITVYGDGFSFSGASNVICRYLRIRMGKVGADGKDGLGIANGSDMIFDHVSVAWGRDETFSISGDNPSNITIQNSIISQGLLGHSAGGLVQTDGGVTIYRTLYIHNDTRNAKIKGVNQYVNNIVYNWRSAAYIMGGCSSGISEANAVGNYFITGKGGGQIAFKDGNYKFNIYEKDNLIDTNVNGILDGETVSRETDFTPATDGDCRENPTKPTFANTPYNYPEVPVIEAKDLFGSLVATVGASLPHRDELDLMLIDDLKSFGTKGDLIGDEKLLPIGDPTTWNVWKGVSDSEDPNRKDTHKCGIPDVWHEKIGFDPNTNKAMDIAPDGYAYMEKYINAITEDNSQYFLKPPIALQAVRRTHDEIEIEWLDGSEWTEGFIIEKQEPGGEFQEVGRIGKDDKKFIFTGLKEKVTYNFRLKSYNAKGESEYSKTLPAKTRPLPVDVIDPETYKPDFIWNGKQDNIWDISTVNWKTSEGTEAAFVNGKNLLFDETGTGGDITIASGVEAGTIFVKGDKDYSLSGVITGSNTLNKSGSGKLTLGNNNTFNQGTIIWDGTLEIGRLANAGSPSSLGTAANMVWKGGTIRYTGGNASTDREIALEKTTTFDVAGSSSRVTFTGNIEGEGDFIKAGAGSVYSTFQKVYDEHTGNIIIKEGTFEMNSGGIYNDVLLGGKVILEGGRFRTTGSKDPLYGELNFDVEVNGPKRSYFQISQYSRIKGKFSGEGDLQLDLDFVREFYQGDWTEFQGNLYVEASNSGNGVVWMINNATKGGIPNARSIVGNNVTMWAGTNGATTVLGALSGSSGAQLGCSFHKSDGGFSTWVIGGLDTDETFNGKVTNNIYHTSRIGKTNIVKEGEGYWRLTGANKYIGTTEINNGTFILNGTHGQDKDHTNTNFKPGTYTVNMGGTLAGKGSTEAPVVVKDGGVIAPGDHGIGTFTVKNTVTLESGSTLNIEVNRSVKTCDRLSTEKVTIAGNLNVDLINGSFANGDEMQIMSANSYSGSFANISPANPGEELYWDITELYTKGKLKVTNEPEGIYGESVNEIIMSANGCIVVEGLIAEKEISVYNLSGVKIYSTVTASDCNIPVERGIYFVKVGDKTSKVLVR